jgi:hypothetical protein
MAGCFTLEGAGALVLGCFPAGTSLDTTLEGAGLITDNQRTALRQRLLQKVDDRGCSIQPTDIPVDGSTTLQAIMDALFDKAKVVAGATS